LSLPRASNAHAMPPMYNANPDARATRGEVSGEVPVLLQKSSLLFMKEVRSAGERWRERQQCGEYVRGGCLSVLRCAVSEEGRLRAGPAPCGGRWESGGVGVGEVGAVCGGSVWGAVCVCGGVCVCVCVCVPCVSAWPMPSAMVPSSVQMPRKICVAYARCIEAVGNYEVAIRGGVVLMLSCGVKAAVLRARVCCPDGAVCPSRHTEFFPPARPRCAAPECLCLLKSAEVRRAEACAMHGISAKMVCVRGRPGAGMALPRR